MVELVLILTRKKERIHVDIYSPVRHTSVYGIQMWTNGWEPKCTRKSGICSWSRKMEPPGVIAVTRGR